MNTNIRMIGASLALALTLPLAACGEDAPADVPGSAVPSQSENRLIDDVTPSEQVETETDPTPQSSTGGGIPGQQAAPAGEDDGGSARGDVERPSAQ
ncbi:MAG: hypothetical protein ACK4U0_13020 [Mesorhizobium sp.]